MQQIDQYSVDNDIFILGDLNSHIGNKRTQYFMYQNSVVELERSLASAKEDSRGRSLVEMANLKRLVILNGVFGQSSCPPTFVPANLPDHHTVVDFIISSYTFYRKLDNFKVVSPLDIDPFFAFVPTKPDHTLVTASFTAVVQLTDEKSPLNQLVSRSTWSRSPHSPGEKVKWQFYQALLQDQMLSLIAEIVRAGQFQPAPDVNSFYDLLVRVIINSARESGILYDVHFDPSKPRMRAKWSPTVTQAMRDRNALYRETFLNPSEHNTLLFRQACSVVKKTVREYKTTQSNKLACELKLLKRADPRQFWKIIHGFTNPRIHQPMSSVIVYEGITYRGADLTTPFMLFYRDLRSLDPNDPCFNRDFYLSVMDSVATEVKKGRTVVNEDEFLERGFKPYEVQRAINKLKNGKACDRDLICGEALKYGGEGLQWILHYYCNLLWESEQIPQEWRRSIIVTLFKSGEKRDPAMYRPISLISVMSKVYLELVREKLKYAIRIKNILPDEQNAFREKRGCEDNVFIFHEILSIMKQQGRNVYAAYIDIKKAYDRVFIFGLWAKLLRYGIRGKLWRVLREIYLGSVSSVKFENYLSAFFETREGLRQGCKLSTDLFSVFIADLVRVLNESGDDGLTFDQILYLCNLLFADDILLLAKNVPGLQRLLWVLETWCWDNRFIVNVGKSGCMRFRFNYHQYPSSAHFQKIEFDNNLLPDVFNYKYCGVWMSQSFESKDER
jgi:hypothetical protein